MKIEIVARKIDEKLGYFYYLVDSKPIYSDMKIAKLFKISYDEYIAFGSKIFAAEVSTY